MNHIPRAKLAIAVRSTAGRSTSYAPRCMLAPIDFIL